MELIKYPSEQEFDAAAAADEPLLVLISFDGEKIIASQIDEAVEHHILLRKVGLPDTDIDKFFRVVADKSGADWTFVCPPDYCNMTLKDKRIEKFYKDGLNVIPKAMKAIGYDVPIDIPKRYRRHFDMLGDNSTIQ